MNVESRIPKLNEVSFDGALVWFAELQIKGLMFHPDDEPAEIERISDGQRVFSDPEAAEVKFVMNELFVELGEDVYEAAYPIVMNSVGLRLDA